MIVTNSPKELKSLLLYNGDNACGEGAHALCMRCEPLR